MPHAIEHIQPADARARLDANPDGVTLLDVREADELEIARVADALWIPMSELAQRVRELDPAREVLVMCHHGLRSQRVAQWLSQSGFQAVLNVAGGIDAWAIEVDRGLPRY